MTKKLSNSSLTKLDEPFLEEINRIRLDEFSNKAIQFAYKLESIPKEQKPNKMLRMNKNKTVFKETNQFYDRYFYQDSASIGLLLTNIDKSRIKLNTKRLPSFYTMGFERLKLAAAQRALFFDSNQNVSVHKTISDMERNKKNFPRRSNKRSIAIEMALGISQTNKTPTRTPAFTEIGYKKISSAKRVSRNDITKNGLFNIIGKHPRKILGVGAMPPVSGWRDVLVISAIGHMLSFAPRSSIYANNIELRIKLIRSAKQVIEDLDINSVWKKRSLRNIGASLGVSNPKLELQIATQLYKKAGVRMFRLYTIGSDPRVIETAKLLREKFGDDIEIFVGQIADIAQAENLVSANIKVDGLIYGHGGGQQCTSATNGMALTNLEDLYLATISKKLNNTSIIAEGGIGRSIGVALMMGVDAALGNQKLVRGAIETMNLFIKDKNDDICQPYPGTASPVTQLIEAEDILLRKNKLDAAGRTYQSEGKPGFMYYKNKANSSAFWINLYLSHAARTLADVGVSNIMGLRNFMRTTNVDLFRILTEKTIYVSSAHKDSGT